MKYGCSMRMAGRSFTMRKECQVCGGADCQRKVQALRHAISK